MILIEEKIIDGAEPFLLKGNEIGIILSHGFAGTPQSVKQLGEQLNHFGYTVYAPRLTGHGTDIYDMEKAKYTDWAKDLDNAFFTLKKYCKEIFVIGQSMGGALALQLAATNPEIKGVMTINAALNVPAYDEFRYGKGPRFVPEGAPDIKDPHAEEITYDQIPLTAINELHKVLEETIDQLDKVSTPILAMASKDDHVVPPSDSDYIYQKVASKIKRQIVLKNSYHVASLDYDQPKIGQYCHEFLKKFTNI